MGRAGEVYVIYVDPRHWARGVGRALMGDARTRLAEDGYDEALLWVLDSNERAERFYRLDGWKADGTQRRENVHGVVVEEPRYRSLRVSVCRQVFYAPDERTPAKIDR